MPRSRERMRVGVEVGRLERTSGPARHRTPPRTSAGRRESVHLRRRRARRARARRRARRGARPSDVRAGHVGRVCRNTSGFEPGEPDPGSARARSRPRAARPRRSAVGDRTRRGRRRGRRAPRPRSRVVWASNVSISSAGRSSRLGILERPVPHPPLDREGLGQRLPPGDARLSAARPRRRQAPRACPAARARRRARWGCRRTRRGRLRRSGGLRRRSTGGRGGSAPGLRSSRAAGARGGCSRRA